MLGNWLKVALTVATMGKVHVNNPKEEKPAVWLRLDTLRAGAGLTWRRERLSDHPQLKNRHVATALTSQRDIAEFSLKTPGSVIPFHRSAAFLNAASLGLTRLCYCPSKLGALAKESLAVWPLSWHASWAALLASREETHTHAMESQCQEIITWKVRIPGAVVCSRILFFLVVSSTFAKFSVSGSLLAEQGNFSWCFQVYNQFTETVYQHCKAMIETPCADPWSSINHTI